MTMTAAATGLCSRMIVYERSVKERYANLIYIYIYTSTPTRLERRCQPSLRNYAPHTNGTAEFPVHWHSSYTSLTFALYFTPTITMAKPSKAFKKFASSGKLKETIQKRRSTQQARRKFEDRVAQRKKQRGSAKDEGLDEEDDEEDSEDERSDKALGVGGRAGGVGKEVDDLLKDDLRLAGPDSEGEGSEDEEDLEDDEDELDEDDVEGIDDDEKDLEMDEAAMKKAMKQLEKNDPEFFKYLKENDQDLLEFGDKPASGGDVDMDGEENEDDDDEEEEDDDENMDEDEEEQRAKTPVTRKMLREWQEGMLRVCQSVH